MAKQIKRWITVNGAHVPIYEGEEVADAIGRLYGDKKDEVVVGGRKVSVEKKPLDKDLQSINNDIQKMSDEELRDYIMKTFIEEDSYINNSEYKELQEELKTTWEEADRLKKEWLDLYDKASKAIDQEDYNDLLDKFDGDKELARMMAKKTPEGEQYKKQSEEVNEKEKILRDKWKELDEKREQIKTSEAKRQRIKYITDFENTVSKDVKEEYEGFQFDTGVSAYEDFKNNGGQILEMSPQQYLHECAHNIFESTYENQVMVTAGDAGITKDLVDKITHGTKMYMPVLDYQTDNQEGRHRAMAAMLLGIDRIPVLIRRRK